MSSTRPLPVSVWKGRAILFIRLASTGLLSIPGLALPASHASLEICLAASMLWKVLISYLGRSSMHQDNKPNLISLCSLMSQLKGLVLLLSMRLAERIVCRLVNAGLWRSWSTFKMLVLCLRRSYVCAAARFPVSNGGSSTHRLVGIVTDSEIYSYTYHIRQASCASQIKNEHPRPTMLLNVFGIIHYYSVAD